MSEKNDYKREEGVSTYSRKFVNTLKQLNGKINILCSNVRVQNSNKLCGLQDNVERFQVIRLLA